MDKSKQQERVDEGASYLRTLIDWEGVDLRAYVFSIILVVIFGYVLYLAWKKLLEWQEKSKRPHIQYKVLKPPSTVLAESDPANKKKRICAVIGGTGFVGSHVVNELVRRGEYYVYVLGRTFRPERTNPDADCLIQVDILDFDGLVNALQGVESIINAAAIVPNIFMDADEVWHKNKIGQENILHAAKKAGVKNIVYVSGMRLKGKLTDPVMKAFINIMLYHGENNVLKENGIDGLSTCAVAPGNIIGLNSSFIDMLTSGQLTSVPMSDSLPVSFLPVEYVAKALANAENKLASGDQEVCGKGFPLRGEVMSWRQLFSLPGWPKKISENPKWILSLIIKINVFCVSVFRRAPFGADLSPDVMEMFSLTEEDMKESECQRVYDVLGVGPPPPMEQYVKEMVDKYKKLKPSKANNKDK